MKLIKELPEDVKVIALQRQVEQGNVKNENVGMVSWSSAGGFKWSETPEGWDIWEEAHLGNYSPFLEFHAKLQAEAEQKETPPPAFSPKTGEWVMTEEGKRIFLFTHGNIHWCVAHGCADSFFKGRQNIPMHPAPIISPILPTFQIPLSEAKEILAAAKGCTVEQVEIV